MLKDSELSSPGPRTFQGTREHPVTFWWPMWGQELWNQRISEKWQKWQNSKNALSHQNAHQHMLSTFRGQPGILGVRTVPARVAAISSQARAMGPCPAFPSLLQPFKGPGSVPCAQGASRAGQAMCRPCGGPGCPRLWPATQGSVKGQEAFSAA